MSANPPSASDAEPRWLQAIAAGELGVWDLRLELDTVQYSPPWKQRFGYPEPDSSDSTDFWRCRVHPADFGGMLAAIRAHMQGQTPDYEARFRLRSNGSGYRTVHSRGRVIERGADERQVRMVGTMIDLTERPPTPQSGLPDGRERSMKGMPVALPLHQLLCAEQPGPELARERERVLGLVGDLLDAALAQLNSLRPAQS